MYFIVSVIVLCVNNVEFSVSQQCPILPVGNEVFQTPYYLMYGFGDVCNMKMNFRNIPPSVTEILVRQDLGNEVQRGRWYRELGDDYSLCGNLLSRSIMVRLELYDKYDLCGTKLIAQGTVSPYTDYFTTSEPCLQRDSYCEIEVNLSGLCQSFISYPLFSHSSSHSFSHYSNFTTPLKSEHFSSNRFMSPTSSNNISYSSSGKNNADDTRITNADSPKESNNISNSSRARSYFPNTESTNADSPKESNNISNSSRARKDFPDTESTNADSPKESNNISNSSRARQYFPNTESTNADSPKESNNISYSSYGESNIPDEIKNLDYPRENRRHFNDSETTLHEDESINRKNFSDITTETLNIMKTKNNTEEPITKSLEPESSHNIIIYIIVLTCAVVIITAIVVFLIIKYCCNKSTPPDTVQLRINNNHNPFYINFLFRSECDQEIQEIEQHQYEEIYPQSPSVVGKNSSLVIYKPQKEEVLIYSNPDNYA